ncbi:MAG TPA: hypothetical protein DDY13_03640 [Cytophagales bacterium]|jgi:hypothetical protein|nr:hypothetical protein [Cytophagales bacterium]
MVDIKKLDEDLIALIEKRNELKQLDYNDSAYDDMEEELHDMEDDFVENYGDFLEDALQAVHDEFCPENDVLLPTAYIAKAYKEVKDEETGETKFLPTLKDGVLVDVEMYLNHVSRLVIVPKPTRIVLSVDNSHAEEVWNSENAIQS